MSISDIPARHSKSCFGIIYTLPPLTMRTLAALFAVIVLAAPSAHGRSEYPEAQLFEQAERLNDRCRGGSGDDPATMRACDQRDAVITRLKKAGWCYGKESDYGYQRVWQRCHAGVAAPAKSTEITGYVFSRGGGNVSPGDVIRRDDMIYVLYSHVPCSLPIAAAPNMQAAELFQGRKLTRACWAPTISPLADKFTIVSQYGHVESSSLFGFVETRFRADGDAIAVGPAISQHEYRRRLDEYMRSLR
ncbi:hypothetical protein FOB72_03070 [Cupriavidus pauculus]|uniref:Uncharacterized protein n=1 Tax=Cupriavidus pauculus TaxID=82633 RepID=A0A5P2H138_9BURK|nr:hypothetical protein [Cupriavidus pauculus]QET01120.1 hypothetical protein FOB72_03070 [Cupriavidus pauculus]